MVAWLSAIDKWRSWIDAVFGIQDAQPVTYPLETLRVVVETEDGRVGDFIDLPYPDRLYELGRAVVAGGYDFSMASFGGAGKLFSRSEYVILRDAMIRRGLATWINSRAHGQGVTLTAPGRAVMRKLATRTPPRGRDALMVELSGNDAGVRGRTRMT
jgi:hypothetical protein